jgi:hypothetical protein
MIHLGKSSIMHGKDFRNTLSIHSRCYALMSYNESKRFHIKFKIGTKLSSNHRNVSQVQRLQR